MSIASLRGMIFFGVKVKVTFGIGYEVRCLLLWVLGSLWLIRFRVYVLGLVRVANDLLGFADAPISMGWLCVAISGVVTFYSTTN